jgi:3-dehydroquinate synthase
MGPLPAIADVAVDEVLEGVTRDKKVVSGTLHYVLPQAIGRAMVVADVTGEELEAGIRSIGLTRRATQQEPAPA